MKRTFDRLSSLYGEHPLHLLAFAATFALAGYVAASLFAHQTVRVAVWFAGAAVAHDLLVLPLYALANAVLTAVWRRTPHIGSISWLNYVRFPSAISAVLFLVYLPEITRQRTALMRDSGLSTTPYLGHWLLVVALLFALSAGVLTVRVWVGARRPHIAAEEQA